VKLHDVSGESRWCAPWALSAVSGASTDAISDLLSITTGRPEITLVNPAELIAVAPFVGLVLRATHIFVDDPNPPSLAVVAQSLRGVYIIDLDSAKHFIALAAGEPPTMVSCNSVGICALSDYPRKHDPVRVVLEAVVAVMAISPATDWSRQVFKQRMDKKLARTNAFYDLRETELAAEPE
jgi:hypothetical protein